MPDPWHAYGKGSGNRASTEHLTRPTFPTVQNPLLMADTTGSEKKKFSEKVATMNQFDGVNNGGTWKTWARNYLVGQVREMDFLLKDVEHNEDPEAGSWSIRKFAAFESARRYSKVPPPRRRDFRVLAAGLSSFGGGTFELGW